MHESTWSRPYSVRGDNGKSKRKFKVPTWDAKDEFYSYKEEVLLLPPSKEEFNETIKYKFYD